MVIKVRLSMLALVVTVTLLTGFWVEHAPNVGGDTPTLIQGARAARLCIARGELIGCGTRRPRESQGLFVSSSKVGPYPLAQYVPAGILQMVGASDAQTLTGLALLNVLAFLGVLALALAAASQKGDFGLSAVLAVVLLTGPLLWYAYSTFGEMLAALLVLAFVVSVLWRLPWPAVAATLWAAAVTKETALPFLLVMGAVSLYGCGPRAAAPRRQLLGLLVGGVLSALTNVVFNIFRFGELINQDYVADRFRTPTLGLRAELFGALLASKNGGLLTFWTTAFVVLAGLVAAGIRAHARHDDGPWWPAVVLTGTLLALLAGLSSWFNPFGWDAWGPRLLMPWVPALAVLAVCAYPFEFRSAAAALVRTKLRLVLAAAIISALALPHVGVLWKPAAYADLFSLDPLHCPRVQVVDYACLKHRAWERPSVLRTAYGGLERPAGVLFAAALISAITGLLNVVRLSDPRRTDHGEPASPSECARPT